MEVGDAVTVKRIAEGLAIGVGAGIVLAIFNLLGKLLSRWLSRREQIKSLRNRLTLEFRNLGNVNGLTTVYPDLAYQEDRIRYMLVDAALSRLQAIADHHMGALYASEKTNFYELLSTWQATYKFADQLKKYEQLALRIQYAHFQHLKWIKLPWEPPWQYTGPEVQRPPDRREGWRW